MYCFCVIVGKSNCGSGHYIRCSDKYYLFVMKWSLLSKSVAKAGRVMCERLKWKTLLGNWSVKLMLNMAQRRPCWHSWFKQSTEAVISCHNARPCCVQTAVECRQRWFGGTRCLPVRAASDMVSRAFYILRLAAPPTFCSDKEGSQYCETAAQ
jgi:hypothetical protein